MGNGIIALSTQKSCAKQNDCGHHVSVLTQRAKQFFQKQIPTRAYCAPIFVFASAAKQSRPIKDKYGVIASTAQCCPNFNCLAMRISLPSKLCAHTNPQQCKKQIGTRQPAYIHTFAQPKQILFDTNIRAVMRIFKVYARYGGVHFFTCGGDVVPLGGYAQNPSAGGN